MKKNIFLMLIGCFSILGNSLIAQPLQKVFVKGGVLQQGKKQNKVSRFQITTYEITNQQYANFLNKKMIGSGGIYGGKKLISVGNNDLQLEYINNEWESKQGKENYPIVMVSYYGADEFCKWAGGKLPTEAEWTYAALGGEKSKHYRYSGGNTLEKVGWFRGNSEQHSHAVGKKKPNELGIYDMSGNVWEWCLNDTLKSDTDFCVHMGGSWYATELPSRISSHFGNVPTHFSNSVGFRVLFPADPFWGIKNFSENYKAKPWNNKPQEIPGKIQCEWYELGGEGNAYHDQDNINNGSGKLNPADCTFLNEFRMKEGVDISYTKTRNIDNNPYNVVRPFLEKLSVSWTEKGEWINYAVRVNKTGTYEIGIMYTASGDGGIGLDLDGTAHP